MNYFIIGDQDSVLGFGLAGVPGRTAENPEDADTAFSEALASPEIGIILITERTAELIRPRVDRYLFTEDFPLIVEIPDRRGKLPGKGELRDTVNQAIGMKLS